MGVDTRAMCMIGKYFENYSEALDFLLSEGHLNSDQVEQAEDCGELPDDCPVQYQTISCYSEEGGYLGLEVPESLDLSRLQSTIDVVKSIVGEDIGLHNFVYWY